MAQKLAVALIHGAGTPKETFADDMTEKLRAHLSRQLAQEPFDPYKDIVFEPVFWSTVFEEDEKLLWEKLQEGGKLDYTRLRRFTIEFLADAIAYQPTDAGNQTYDQVHSVLAKSLHSLSERAGRQAPLCVIAHSLGSVIATNYFYDLQVDGKRTGKLTKKSRNNTPLEQGHTMALFYTLGSPLALWSLRYSDFGQPIEFPSPAFEQHCPNVDTEWLNFYDRDDVLAYPLKTLNEKYDKAVTQDIEVNVGGLLKSWTPLSHTEYTTDEDVIRPIAKGLANLWRQANEKND